MPTLKAATTDAGAAGAAEVAHLLRPLILDILKQNSKGSRYHLSDDDFVLCLLSFFDRAFLCERQKKKKEEHDDDAGDDGGDVVEGGDGGDVGGLTPTAEETPVMIPTKFKWYNSVNAGWSVVCWALMSGRSAVSRIGRGSFLLAMEGQSPTNRRELADAGIRDSSDFNVAYDRWNRIKPPC